MKRHHKGHILQVGVIGSAGKEEYSKSFRHHKGYLKFGEKLGELLGKKGVTIITGGEGGIMAAVEKGGKKHGATTVGVFKNLHDVAYDIYSDIDIVTSMGEGGPEYILPLCCNVIISMGGGAGTLNEICVAYRNNVSVVLLTGFGGWTDKLAKNLYENRYMDERKRTRFEVVKTPEEAANVAMKIGTKHLEYLIKVGNLAIKNRKRS